MSELADLKKEVGVIGKGVARIEGILDTKLPDLATKDHVDLRIAEHEVESHKSPKLSLVPHNGNTKRIAALSGVVVALSGLLIYLVKMVIF